MIIKHSFKFLNTFCFGLKDEIMFLVRQGLQINWAIIVWNTIKVMDNPTIRQRLAVSFFPYKDVLKNVTLLFYSSRMVRSIYQDIAIGSYNATTFPVRGLMTSLELLLVYSAYSPSINHSTMPAPCSWVRNHSTTIYALPTTPSPLIFELLSIHPLIVSYLGCKCQVQERLDIK